MGVNGLVDGIVLLCLECSLLLSVLLLGRLNLSVGLVGLLGLTGMHLSHSAVSLLNYSLLLLLHVIVD